jgi:fatty acid desaturase
MIVGLYVLTVLAFYRASLFTHELTHLKQDSFRAFRIVWNLLYGIPFLVPSFLYHTHVDHHARRQYGTAHDGEYLPLAAGPRWKILWYLSESFVVPLVAVARFLIAPVTWFSPRLHTWLARHASSMVIDPAYVRPLPTRQEMKIWRLQETACWAFVTTVAVLLTLRIIPLGFLFTAYAVSVGVMLLNSVRTLGAHRYRSNGETMTFVEQLLDSVNYPQSAWIGELWAPVGLRFHALHHLFPSMPYHNLAKAHRRLMQELPANSPYRDTVSHSLWKTIFQLWREAGQAGQHSTAPLGRFHTRNTVSA